MVGGRALLVLAVALAVFAIPIPALAATVTATETCCDADGFPSVTLTYEAGPGENNAVTISTLRPWPSFGGWIVVDTTFGAPPTAGAGCSSIDAQTVECASAIDGGGFFVNMNLADGDDRASLAAACGFASMEGEFGCATMVNAGPGRDSVVANDVDHATVNGGDGRDFLFAGEKGSILRGGANGDHLIGAGGIDRLYGGAGTDFLWAGANNDILRGGEDTDELRAGWGHDDARGGPGRDTIYARDHRRDVVIGGMGFDRARVDSRDAVSMVERFF